jgi:hypothetical protein
MKNVITYADRLADGVAISLAFYTDGFFGYVDACLAQRPCAHRRYSLYRRLSGLCRRLGAVGLLTGYRSACSTNCWEHNLYVMCVQV